MSSPATTLAPGAFVPSSRDRVTIVVAAVALVALFIAPWAAGGGPSAFGRALAGASSMWPLIAAAAALLLCAWWGRATMTALAAALGLAWAFGAGFAAGAGGPPLGIRAPLPPCGPPGCLARRPPRLGLFPRGASVSPV